ncbi:hypothetical protein BGX26_004016 [Mortierella sp. AD094]|nr:hypothetical protein BGX26_004016 [Mortierella sp. AD094]
MSVAVLHKGKLIFAEGFGKRNEHDPFTVETLSEIASVTKAFTAAAIGELVSEGKMDWDTTPVSKYLPEFELQDPTFTSQLTFQDLLSHRTGFPPADEAWLGETASRRDLIKRLKYIQTGSKLRSYVIYNNVMYAVAGEAAANVAGVPYEDLVREKVLRPLGLNNTGFSTSEMSQHANYAMPQKAESFEDAQNGIFEQVPLDNLSTKDAPAGDIYSNVFDLVRYGHAIMHYGEQEGKQILNKDSIIEIFSGQSIYTKTRRTSDFAPIAGYGMGWVLDSYKGNIMYRHSGHVPGFVTNLALFPDSDLVVAHLSNIDTGKLTVLSANYIADELFGLPKTQDWLDMSINDSREMFEEIKRAYHGQFPKRIENKPPTHELREYVGNYWSPIHGDMSVRLKNFEDKDELLIEFRVFECKLEHYHYDSFTTKLRFSTATLAQFVTFVTGSRDYKTDPLVNLRQVLEETRIKSGIPGMSVAVLHKGKLIFAEGFGKRNEHDPFTVETLSEIASVTKAFTAAAIGELVGEGKVDWDTTPVSKYLPEFELQDPTFTSQLTFQDLLSHRTGFPPADEAWLGETASRRDLIKRLKYFKTGSKLRSEVIYNNIMYAVAGEAAANVAGISYEDLVREKVLEPLGLNNTGFSSEEMSRQSNFAMPQKAESFEDAQNGNFIQVPLDNLPTKDAPAGDIYSNVLDLVRWGHAIMHYGELDGKQILNKDSITEILSGQSIYTKTRRTSDFAPIAGYGMGWVLDSYKGNIMYHHNGFNPGFISNLALFPDSDLVVAFLSNIDTAALGITAVYHIADELLGLPKTRDWLDLTINATRSGFEMYAKLARGEFPKRIENKPPTHELAEFVGNYWSPTHGDLSVHLENIEDKEKLRIEFRVFEWKLEHYHYDSFSTKWCFSTQVVAQFVTFATDQDGYISGLQIKSSGATVEYKRKQ